MRNLPAISIEKLERGTDYPTPYRAHIICDSSNHHGEAATPEEALLYATQHWVLYERQQRKKAELRDKVFDNLRNAEDNADPDYWQQPFLDIANDMVMCAADVEDEDPKDLVPHIDAYLKQRKHLRE